MRSWIALIASCFVVGLTAAGGCSSNVDPNAGTNATVTVGSGTVDPFACNNGAADGYCNPRGDLPETCECTDCQLTATCRGACTNDGTCTYNPESPAAGEDCTCDDCYGSHPECPPFASCNNDGTCDPDESSGCSDCDDPSTTSTTTSTGMGGAGGA
ncbi:MAG TPA: hypothetical protein VLS89_00865, partial [Candidatus Nanopelagicales bacterium]|nr:hypothetical protein [Candidatus Nanopelagicales bacterium]